MPDVSFYVLPSQSARERLQFTCKLLEKAYRSGRPCYALTDGAEQSQALDDLLWTFRAGSFIPHQIHDGGPPNPANVVLIGSLPAPEGWCETVLNLSSKLPENLDACARILEILDAGEETKALGRRRYREYQKLGFEIATHKL